MVIVLASDFSNVDRNTSVRAEGSEELLDALGRQLSDLVASEWDVIEQPTASAKIQCNQNQRLIHRGVRTAVSND